MKHKVLAVSLLFYAGQVFAANAADQDIANVTITVGRVMGTLYTAAAVIDLCRAYPAHRQDAEATGRVYLKENAPRYKDGVRNATFALARLGGESLAREFGKQLENDNLPALVEIRKNTKQKIADASKCGDALSSIRSGLLDLDIVRSDDLQFLKKMSGDGGGER